MPDFFAHVFHILSENSDYVQIAKNREFTERFTQKLLSVVLPQINQLIINNDPNVSQEEVGFLSEYIIGGCTYVIAAWIRDNMKTPAERMEEYITEFITRSLMNR